MLTDDRRDESQTQPVNISALILNCPDKVQVNNLLEGWLVSTIYSLVGVEVAACGSYEKIKDLDLKAMGFDSLALVQFKNALVTQLDVPWTVERLHTMGTLSQLHAELAADVFEPEWRSARRELSSDLATPGMDIETSVQQARWISLIGKNYGLRIIPYLIYSPFNAEHCRAALTRVVDEHRLLRTFFPAGKPVVKTTENVVNSFGSLYSDLSSQSLLHKKQYIAERVLAMADALPRPEVDVTWTIHFINVGEPFFIALLGVQHLEFDGKSLSLFFDRFGECLQRLALQESLIPVEHTVDYAAYAQRQHQYLKQWSADVAFFKGLYNAFKTTTVLSGHAGFSSNIPYASSRLSVVAAGAHCALNKWAELKKFSIFNAILYVYARTMAEVIGCNKLIISAITSGRGLIEFNDVLGPFTYPLPIPIILHHEWLEGISTVARTLDSIQNYPLMHPSMLIGEVSTFSGMAQDSYFSDLGINFLNYRQTANGSGRVKIEGVEILSPVSAELLSGANIEEMNRIPGLHLVVELSGDDLRFNFWYHTNRFSAVEVQGWQDRFMHHLEQLLVLARTADEE